MYFCYIIFRIRNYEFIGSVVSKGCDTPQTHPLNNDYVTFFIKCCNVSPTATLLKYFLFSNSKNKMPKATFHRALFISEFKK